MALATIRSHELEEVAAILKSLASLETGKVSIEPTDTELQLIIDDRRAKLTAKLEARGIGFLRVARTEYEAPAPLAELAAAADVIDP